MVLENYMNQDNEIRLNGIGASPGICIGKAYLVENDSTDIVRKFLLRSNTEVEDEIKRFRNAVDKVSDELNQIIDSISIKYGDQLYILESHKALLKDKLLFNKTIEVVKSDRVNAEWALRKVIHGIKQVFNSMEDPFFKERLSDVVHVSNRIIKNLLGATNKKQISDIQKRVILVAHDLSPAETSQIQLEKVQGFITDLGGKTSHTGIIARTLEVPAVLGLGNASTTIKNDDIIIIDGSKGHVILNPKEETLIAYEEQKNILATQRSVSLKRADFPAKTIDGHEIKVMGNIELMEEVATVIHHGGDGIGLYRTEFLYLNLSKPPSEEQLYENYKDVVEIIAPRPVTIRTLDINGDKVAANIYQIDHEQNPVLGLRAIRYCLHRPDVFNTQLRAILRAAKFGNVRLMFPMISGVKELLLAKKALDQAAKELQKEGIPFERNIKVGIMMEVPSAIMTADMLAEHVDFFSIGTNDLIQYTFAIDRGNRDVAHLYQPLHPAIIRMVQLVTNASKNKGIVTHMCGEMAADPFHVPILLALGIDEFSTNPPSIPSIKSMIRKISTANLDQFLLKVMDQQTPDQVIELVQKEYGHLLYESIQHE